MDPMNKVDPPESDAISPSGMSDVSGVSPAPEMDYPVINLADKQVKAMGLDKAKDGQEVNLNIKARVSKDGSPEGGLMLNILKGQMDMNTDQPDEQMSPAEGRMRGKTQILTPSEAGFDYGKE